MKSPQFAIMKSVNYLPNVLSKMEAEENNAFAAIWLDDEGYIAEGPNMNVGFVMKDRKFVVPKFEKVYICKCITCLYSLQSVSEIHTCA